MEELVGKIIGEWTLIEYINKGHSASVFKGQNESTIAAVKVFHPELIEEFGFDEQKKRLDTELELVDLEHDNLIQILGGGVGTIDGTDYLYLVMEYLPWKNLDEFLGKVPYSRIASVVSQLASAACFLEQAGLCHRDIKPANIAVSDDFASVKLLDLGIVKVIDNDTSLTDGEGKQFIGTTQYSPPEFTSREDTGDREGLRAITFYQIGAVIHDLVMRKRLFEEHKKIKHRLYRAIDTEVPDLANGEVPEKLLDLANICLSKTPDTRLTLTWEDFQALDKNPNLDYIKERITRRIGLAQLQIVSEESNSINHLAEYAQRIFLASRSICLSDKHLFPRTKAYQPEHSESMSSWRLCMLPSQNHNLHGFLNVFGSVSMIDTSSKIVELKVHAIIDSEERTNHNLTEDDVVYRGPVKANSGVELIKSLLYVAVDLGQQQENNSACSFNGKLLTSILEESSGEKNR